MMKDKLPLASGFGVFLIGPGILQAERTNNLSINNPPVAKKKSFLAFILPKKYYTSTGSLVYEANGTRYSYHY